MTAETVRCLACNCQIAVSVDRQILLCKNGEGEKVIAGICDPVVTDQVQRQLIPRGNCRRKRNRCAHEIKGICFCAEIAQVKVFQGQRLGVGIVMPAVLFQIAEVFICHKIVSEHDTVILLCRAECLGIHPTVLAVLVTERIFGVRGQISDIVSDEIMRSVRGDMETAHQRAVRQSDEGVNGICTCMDFHIVCRNGLCVIGFAVRKVVFADRLSVCIVEADKERAVRIRNALTGADLVIDLADFLAVRIENDDLCGSVILNRRLFRYGNIRSGGINLFDSDAVCILILRISVAVLIVFHHISQTNSVA